MLQLTSSVLQNFNQAIEYEWLETNGIGGWSGSSVTGCNTRRYHGLLVAAIVPPAVRMALVSKLDETIIEGDQRFELATNNYGEVIYPVGFRYLCSFFKDMFPVFICEAGGVKLKKTIAMVHNENTVVIIYDILEADRPFILELLPLLSVRNYHSMMHANDAIHRHSDFANEIFKTRAYDGTPEIFIKVPNGQFQSEPSWYYNFNYAVEKYRGLDFVEDLFSHGKFSLELKKGESLGIIISTENPENKDAHQLLAAERSRRTELLREQPDDDRIRQLVLAADQFIVKRDSSSTGGRMESLKTIIAGYHWFTDWARDTMISLPGLCLSTGRYEDAQKILSAFANSVSMGMLPNRFQDNGEAPEYNNVDGTLWYFIAVHKYLHATGNIEFVLKDILPVLKDIIKWHYAGTRYHIHVDDDGLLYCGEEGVQLTWMDAKIGDWVVTPRTGKAVEVNALWYNALMIYGELQKLNNDHEEANKTRQQAALVKNNFNKIFWNETAHYLYDVIDKENKDDSFRPNQLFAISLPFPLIENDKAKIILKMVTEKLYTPVGLKTLPKEHPLYIGIYGGDQLHRDAAYHQGTVWSWLLGPYIDAIMKVENDRGAKEAREVIDAFTYHLNERCIGSVSEIFDGDAPHHPRGCTAQAWGVAEILRVVKEYGLYDTGLNKQMAAESGTQLQNF